MAAIDPSAADTKPIRPGVKPAATSALFSTGGGRGAGARTEAPTPPFSHAMDAATPRRAAPKAPAQPEAPAKREAPAQREAHEGASGPDALRAAAPAQAATAPGPDGHAEGQAAGSAAGQSGTSSEGGTKDQIAGAADELPGGKAEDGAFETPVLPEPLATSGATLAPIAETGALPPNGPGSRRSGGAGPTTAEGAPENGLPTQTDPVATLGPMAPPVAASDPAHPAPLATAGAATPQALVPSSGTTAADADTHAPVTLREGTFPPAPPTAPPTAARGATPAIADRPEGAPLAPAAVGAQGTPVAPDAVGSEADAAPATAIPNAPNAAARPSVDRAPPPEPASQPPNPAARAAEAAPALTTAPLDQASARRRRDGAAPADAGSSAAKSAAQTGAQTGAPSAATSAVPSTGLPAAPPPLAQSATPAAMAEADATMAPLGDAAAPSKASTDQDPSDTAAPKAQVEPGTPVAPKTPDAISQRAGAATGAELATQTANQTGLQPTDAAEPAAPASAERAPTAQSAALAREILDVRRADLGRALGARILDGIASGRSTLELSLRPRNLGAIEIRVQMQGSDVAVRMRTETLAAARLLADGEASLARSFETSGLRLSALTTQPTPPVQAPSPAGQPSLSGQGWGMGGDPGGGRQNGQSGTQGRAGRGSTGDGVAGGLGATQKGGDAAPHLAHRKLGINLIA